MEEIGNTVKKGGYAGSSMFSKAENENSDFWIQKRQSLGQNASLYKVSRLRLLVFSFGALVLLLGALLFYAIKEISGYRGEIDRILAARTPEQLPEQAPAANPAQDVGMLVAARNVAEGERIDEDAIRVTKVAAAHFPEGAFLSNRRTEVAGKFAAAKIEANSPFFASSMQEKKASSAPFPIPRGYRAVAITVDTRAGVDRFAKPGTFVDVLWFDGSKTGARRVAKIISRVKVVSVAGSTGESGIESSSSGSANVTLLVTNWDAKLLELARNIGVLTLSLVSDDETVEESEADRNQAVTEADLIRRVNEDTPKAMKVDGVLQTADPLTGEAVKFVLSDQGWIAADMSKKSQKDLPRDVEVPRTWVKKYDTANASGSYGGMVVKPGTESAGPNRALAFVGPDPSWIK